MNPMGGILLSSAPVWIIFCYSVYEVYYCGRGLPEKWIPWAGLCPKIYWSLKLEVFIAEDQGCGSAFIFLRIQIQLFFSMRIRIQHLKKCGSASGSSLKKFVTQPCKTSIFAHSFRYSFFNSPLLHPCPSAAYRSLLPGIGMGTV